MKSCIKSLSIKVVCLNVMKYDGNWRITVNINKKNKIKESLDDIWEKVGGEVGYKRCWEDGGVWKIERKLRWWMGVDGIID